MDPGRLVIPYTFLYSRAVGMPALPAIGHLLVPLGISIGPSSTAAGVLVHTWASTINS
jgi:hypothetical protein